MYRNKKENAREGREKLLFLLIKQAKFVALSLRRFVDLNSLIIGSFSIDNQNGNDNSTN